MVVLDVTIVNVALPQMRSALDMSTPGQQPASLSLLTATFTERHSVTPFQALFRAAHKNAEQPG
jgi:hypothetical protein